MTTALLEEQVLAKPYFDRAGLIVAAVDRRPVGFVHAGFGARDNLGGVNHQSGVICQVLLLPQFHADPVARDLLAAGEDYLQRHGARQLRAGGWFPANPFYLGMYGGSELPGILADDEEALRLFQAAGYREIGRAALLQLPLAGFRMPIERWLLKLRPRAQVRVFHPVAPANWWESCTGLKADWTRYEFSFRDEDQPLTTATFWDLQPLARSWGAPAAGIVRVEDSPDARRDGLTTFLLADACLEMKAQEIGLVEAQVNLEDAATLAIFRQLGFREYNQGIMLVKE